MKIYLISNENDAKIISQLLKLNSECAKLHWSKNIKDLSTEVIGALETIEGFVEEKVYEICTEKALASSLSEDDESTLMALLRKNPELRATLGVGIVMAGDEAKNVSNLLEGKTYSKELFSAINSGKNVVLF